VENDPWGVPYKLVMKKLGGRTPALEDCAALDIVQGLFPSLPTIVWAAKPVVVEPSGELESIQEDRSELFTRDELLVEVNILPMGKAPGPENMLNEIIRLTVISYPKMFLMTYNACIRSGHFSVYWKRAKLVLLYKEQDKPHDAPSSYRPISLFNGPGKLLERMLLRRLEYYAKKSLNARKFGFRRSRSTTDAISEVLQTAIIDNRGMIRGEPDIPLLPVTCGVLRESVLGPTLWNLFYNGILWLPVPNSVKLIAFADDLAVVAMARNSELVEQVVNLVLSVIV